MKSLSLKTVALRWLSVLAILLLASCGGDSDDQNLPLAFTAKLTGAQETPPNTSAAKGTAVAVVNRQTKTMAASVGTTGMTGNAAHIHAGVTGVSGPIVFPLTETSPGSGIWSTKVVLSDDQLAALKAGSLYVNVHSEAFPDGEIRGQLMERQLTEEQSEQLRRLKDQEQQIKLLQELIRLTDGG